MPMESCGICRQRVLLDDTVHVLIHTKSDAGVKDSYVCRDCYGGEIEPLFEGRDR